MAQTYHVWSMQSPSRTHMSFKRSRIRVVAALLLTVSTFVFAQDGPVPVLPNFDRRSPIVLAVENVGPAVVSIRTQTEMRPGQRRGFDPFGGGLFQQQEPDEVIEGHSYRERSQGSGVIVHPYGYILTNYHVVVRSDRITVTLPDGGKGRTLECSLINADLDNDVAILKIKTPGPFPYAILGDSDRLFVGETTIALGNPFGLSSSATTGILSAKDRSVTLRGEVVFKDFMQTSALINPGNSGGPLLDINGTVIGINVAIDQRGPGIGYAIPINRVRQVAADLLDPEMVRHAWLGLDVNVDRGGLVVERVSERGPAAKQNIVKGDRILAVGTKRVENRLGLNIELLEFEAGANIPLTVRREKDFLVRIPFEPVPQEEVRAAGHRFDTVGLVVSDVTPAIASTYGLDERMSGVVITKVISGSTAEQLQLNAGDLVTALGGYRVQDTASMTTLVRALARNYKSVEIRVLRKGKQLRGALPLE
jgi:serine protease Do